MVTLPLKKSTNWQLKTINNVPRCQNCLRGWCQTSQIIEWCWHRQRQHARTQMTTTFGVHPPPWLLITCKFLFVKMCRECTCCVAFASIKPGHSNNLVDAVDRGVCALV
jgi:hypothetical protein